MTLSSTRKLLDVQGLSIAFATDRGQSTVVRDLDLHVSEGETLAIVGESGSGKSVTALSITRLIDHTGGHIAAGRIMLPIARGERATSRRKAPKRCARCVGQRWP